MNESDSENYESAPENEEEDNVNLPKSIKCKATESSDKSEIDVSQTLSVQTNNDSSQQMSVSNVNCIEEPKPINTGGGSYWSSSSWSSWSKSLLTVAQSSVITLAHQVNEGLQTVSQSVEKVLDVPSPEELADERHKCCAHLENSSEVKINEEPTDPNDSLTKMDAAKTEVKENIDDQSNKSCVSDGDQAWWNAVSKTSITLASGGLNVLESIGKKTMEVIQETDPGLKKTKALLKPNVGSTTLSQALREAQTEQAVNSKDSPSETTMIDTNEGNDHRTLMDKEALLNKLRTLSEDCHNRNVAKLATQSREEVLQTRQFLHLIRERVAEFISKDFNEEPSDKNALKSTELIFMEEGELARLLEGLQIRQIQKLVTQRRNHVLVSSANTSSSENQEDKGDGEKNSGNPQQLFSVFSTEMSQLCEWNTRFCLGTAELLLSRSSQIDDWTLFINSLYNIFVGCSLDMKTVSQKHVSLMKQKRTAANRREVGQCLTNIFLDTENGFTSIKDLFGLLQPILSFALLRTVDSSTK